MDNAYLPTKRNLILLKDSLKLSKQGQGLLEQKKLVLMRQMQKYEIKAKQLREEIEILFEQAYHLLDWAYVEIGMEEMIELSNSAAVENSIDLQYKSIMGVEIPSVIYRKKDIEINYGLYNTTIHIDQCMNQFKKIKEILIQTAEIENTIIKIKASIGKIQRRSNALKDLIIPRTEKAIYEMQNTLEEREREEMTRLKVIKKNID